mmetsp:Transcript_38542/g.100118  ORF Transcript_38542/g.100118 Transcript_38542/m.100118 type:complete len:273 (-) Transcript_38542:858-1676(-)
MASPTTAALPIDMAPTAAADPATKAASKPVPAKPPKKCEVPGAVCDLCRAPIALGEDIWPINPPTSVPGGTAATAGDSTLVAQAAAGGRRAKGKYWWAHARPCAETHLGGVLAPPPCIRWTIGECEYGAACFYSHPDRTALPAGAANGVAPQDSAGGGGGAPGNGGARRKKVLNSSKCSTLRRFLVDEFGGAVGLRRGSGVVDVAGGRQPGVRAAQLPGRPLPSGGAAAGAAAGTLAQRPAAPGHLCAQPALRQVRRRGGLRTAARRGRQLA